MNDLATTVVVPTVGRPSLVTLIEALVAGGMPAGSIVVVDDRPGECPLWLDQYPGLRVLRSGGRGPAAARNLGWRSARTPWVSFLDDDVVPSESWTQTLADDLAACGPAVAASQGRVRVPLPDTRRPTDWERTTAGLADAAWITADLTCRRAALADVGGFDERFPRAFREDADLALRLMDRGWTLVRGTRAITHPVRPADRWVSVRAQAGNADDMLMRRLHGPGWRQRAGAPSGRRTRHLATTAAGVLALAALAVRRPAMAAVAGSAYVTGVVGFVVERVRPGPGTRGEIADMALTGVLIPPAATWHSMRGLIRHRRARPWRGTPELVLFDRDGTLVHDVPYNGDPELVWPMPEARASLDRLRAAGVRVGVVTNQSGVASGRITEDQVRAVNARVERELGPFDAWRYCPHGPRDGCGCRKPAPGMIKDVCAELGVPPAQCVVVGDVGADVGAAQAAGASAILVPTAATRPDEIDAAERKVPDLRASVDLLLGGTW